MNKNEIIENQENMTRYKINEIKTLNQEIKENQNKIN